MLVTYNIFTSLHDTFGFKGRSTRQAILKLIMNAKMFERTLVRDNIIYMIRLFNKRKILRVEIDGGKPGWHGSRDLVKFFQVVQAQLYYK